jgi:hypothetical protein
MGWPALAAGLIPFVKTWKIMGRVEQPILTIGRNSFYYLLFPSAALI